MPLGNASRDACHDVDTRNPLIFRDAAQCKEYDLELDGF
jgi:hypothetical protein